MTTVAFVKVVRPNDGKEVHASTGKKRPKEEFHPPNWSEWDLVHPIFGRRLCLHPGCDIEEYDA